MHRAAVGSRASGSSASWRLAPAKSHAASGSSAAARGASRRRPRSTHAPSRPPAEGRESQ
eukprot:9799294-Alexandrium_andersonii.AAC.1